jgi:D-beta-D-heptose 7-phosphate kinase/D-beta-D-heptose 1-phosphate adenosyltransferase
MHARGERLVLSNGCFDLLHLGHVRYLQSARVLGDALAVAINSDRSLRQLKGPGRPITPQEERAEIVAALQCVEFVTVFDGPTAAPLVELVRPALYVKGGDYSDDPSSPRFPPEGTAVQAYGGKIAIIPLEPGYSTSSLLERVCSTVARE